MSSSGTNAVVSLESGKRAVNVDVESGGAKKQRIDDESLGSHLKWESLESFKFVKVLKGDAHSKSVCIHAKSCVKESLGNKETAGDGNSAPAADAIIVLEKSAFDTTDSGICSLLSPQTSLKQLFNNDIYGTYESYPPDSLNSVKTVIIFPASAKHLEKYQSHEVDIIYESGEDYRNITLPFIQSSSFDMQWIYNILAKKKESEFIIFEDPDPMTGYILIPDLKWDRKSLDTMYLSGIIHRHGIKSLRDLTTEHLPLLKNIMETAAVAIENEYGIKRSKIRAYFHYQPSYYHLHVHFNQVKWTPPGSNVIGAILLSDVMENIEQYPDYYQKKTLPFPGKANAQLYQCYKRAGKI